MSAELLMVVLAEKLAIEYIPKALAGFDIPEQLTHIVLEVLIGALQEQHNASDEKLRGLIGSYYKSGTDYLSDAKGLQGERREEWIKEALSQFVTASHVEDTLLAAKSQFFVGVCYDLLNETQLAREWYEKAYKAASKLAAQWQGSPRQLVQLQPFMDTLSQVLRAHGSTLSIPQPTHAYGYFLRGETYNLKKRWQEALAAYEQAIRLDPNFGFAYRGKGDALTGLGRWQEALAAYEQAIRLDPNFGFAYRGKGDALIGLGRWQEALAAYEQAISLGPFHRLPAYKGKGDALFRLGRYQEALAAYEQAIRLDSYSATLHHNKGNALNSLGRYQEALTAYEQAIRLDPNFGFAYNGKAIVLERLGRRNEAKQFYEKASQLGYVT